MKIVITGGAGFIGSALVRYLIDNTNNTIVNLDKLTYAGNLLSLKSVAQNPRYFFEKVDICSPDSLSQIFIKYNPDAVMHLAAESHVDRSINNAKEFIETNILGTYTLLEQARIYWQQLPQERKASFRFHHISTDEVYGDLDNTTDFFTEKTPYAPSSPYSASKASSDHLVRAWHRTYGLPIILSNCSNNYGPYQYPEKLIPLVILSALSQQSIPVYGSGLQVRDWLYVDDHVKALYTVLKKGAIGETYNIGGNNEKTNIAVIQTICALLEEMIPCKDRRKYTDLITYVNDRPGHDKRYAIDSTKIKRDLNWMPETSFEKGLRETIAWYLNNSEWIQSVSNHTSTCMACALPS